jgi:hypothetical protein
MSTIKVNSIKNTSTDDGGIAIDNSGHVQIDGQQLPTAGALSSRNRIINGDMRIDQRNNGGVVTSGYPVDRFQIEAFSGGGAADVEQVVDSPTDGFYHSMKVDVTTADTSLAAGDFYTIRTIVEGNDVVDLRYGLSGAKTVTLSFWVKSNLTGTFCAALGNGANNRSNPKEYTISTANTWEHKTLTFTGDTSGTWERSTGRGLQVRFCLGSGSTRQGTADTWNAAEIHCTSNQANLFASTSNEWYVTGVQLEVGEKATPFEHRSFGDELARCQRYFMAIHDPRLRGTVNTSTVVQRIGMTLPTTMRAEPTYTTTGTYDVYDGAGIGTVTGFIASYTTLESVEFDANLATGSLNAGRPACFFIGTRTNQLNISAEL